MTAHDPRVMRAIEAMEVLKNAEGVPDYQIKPSEHASKLSSSAPELAAMLNESDLKTDVNEYEAQDLKAGLAQRRFRTAWMWAAWSAFVFTVASGLVMAVNAAMAEGSDWRRALATAFSIVAVLSGALGAGMLTYLKKMDLYKQWRTARAEAEARRCEIAARLAKKEPGGAANPIFVRLCQLEYLRKIILDSQVDYYTRRGSFHEHRASSLAVAEAVGAGLIAISALGVGAGVLTGGQAGNWLPVLGVIAGALTALVAGYDQLYQHAVLASMYEKTRTALNRVMGDLDRTRRVVVEGKTEALPAFVEAMLSPMQAEHQAWREQGAGSDEAYQRLASILGGKETPPGGAGGAGGTGGTGGAEGGAAPKPGQGGDGGEG